MSTKRAMIHVLLRSEQSAGVVSMIESGSLPDFGGPPLHHHDFDETFYVMEGELTFQLGDELFSAKAGELTFAPGRRAARVGAAADPPRPPPSVRGSASGTSGIDQATGGGDLHDRELQRASAHAGLRGSGHGARRRGKVV